MGISLETKEWLASIFALGFGFGCLVGMILLLCLYFRLTRKYDAMFPEYYRTIALTYGSSGANWLLFWAYHF